MNRFLACIVVVVVLGILRESSAQSPSCTVCVNLMAFAEPLAPKMSELDLQVVMHAYCNQQPDMQEFCKHLVDRFMYALYLFLAGQAPPTLICTEIGVCP